MDMVRTIHPAGFGAFCTERFYGDHKNFNMVYDCGSLSTGHKPVLRGYFDEYFASEDVIDLLCISHFDEDHINVIRDLIDEGQYIKRGKTTVLIPYLAKSYALFKTEVDQIDKYFALQQTLTEHGIKTIAVRPSGRDDQLRDEQEALVINPEGENQIIDSGSPLRTPYPFWMYVPMFIFNEEKYNKILEALKTADEIYPALTQEELDNFINGDMNETVLGKLKKVCSEKGLSGKGTTPANMSSMMLLSTQSPMCRHMHSVIEHGSEARLIYMHCYQDCCCRKGDYYHHLRKSSCLYTGDISLADNKTNEALQKYKVTYFNQGIGLLQIPHHGAWGCYDVQTIRDVDCLAAFVNTDLEVDSSRKPVFYSQMVLDFNDMKKNLYLVLKDKATTLVQEIWV